MSQAQEEEIRQLHERLKVVQAEKATESARAAALQVALFEASMKTRQVLDACKRDAVEVAVEEAVKHHYMARAEMDELVGNIAQDRTKLLSVQGSLLDLQARATKYATILTDCTIRSISEPCASGDGRKDYHGDGIAPIIERGGENAHANGCTEGSSFQESEALIRSVERSSRDLQNLAQQALLESRNADADSPKRQDVNVAVAAAFELAFLTCKVFSAPDMQYFFSITLDSENSKHKHEDDNSNSVAADDRVEEQKIAKESLGEPDKPLPHASAPSEIVEPQLSTSSL